MSNEDRRTLPAPGWSPLTEGFWTAAGKNQLVVQRCSNCGAHRAPPAWACYACQSNDWTWDEVVGTGTVFSFTWADQRAVMTSPIYNLSIIELDGTKGEPVRIMTQVKEVDKEGLSCDLPVEVCFETFDDEINVPMFKPRS